MTTLRFLGEVPLWLGLLLALIVGVLSWRYYNRESFDLPRHLRWMLPLLRSAAFFLGIMLLTGPVLHHRKTIGQLGQVQIYVDASGSMTLHDRHLPLARKLRIAESLGWIAAESVDTSLVELADEVATAASNMRPTEEPTLEHFQQSARQLGQKLQELAGQFPPDLREELRTQVLDPLKALEADPAADAAKLNSLSKLVTGLEQELRKEFDDSLRKRAQSGDESIQAAITLFDETPRWRRAELALQSPAGNVVTQLKERHNVRLLKLDGELAASLELPEDSASNTDEMQPNDFAGATDLSSGVLASQKGIAEASNTAEAGTQPQTAVVLITDGQHNSGPSPLQTARLLGGQGVACFPVALGSDQPAADLAVIGLTCPDLVFARDRVRGVMLLKDSVPEGRPFVAQISYQDEVLWQQQLLTQNVAERRVEFEFSLEELVKKLGSQFSQDVTQHILPLALTASVSPLAEESEPLNNQRTMRLAAILQNDRVLILDGRSRWETRYLRNAFERDEQWQVNTIIAGPGNDEEVLPRGDHDGQFPASREALFEYDLIILGEISTDLFSAHELQWLKEFVEIRGGGMIFVDGQRGLLRQYNEQNLGALMPVKWSGNPISSKPSALKLTDRGASESALRLVAEEQPNRQFWSELPTPHNLVAVEALPGAEVLVEADVSGQSYPAMVTHRFGAGKVLYLAFDESWRWRYKAADTWHQRVWNQLAKFVMPKPFAVSDEYISLDTGPVRYAAGDNVAVRAQILGLDGKPSVSASAEALIWKGGQIVGTVPLTADAAVPGLYAGKSASLDSGEYEVTVRVAGYADAALKARSEFVVELPQSAELAETSANLELLREMAAAGQGTLLLEEEIGRLPDLLSPLSSGRVVESDTQLWQSPWCFVAMILLLTIEWILRKRSGLL